MNLRALGHRLIQPIVRRWQAPPIGVDFAGERLNMLQMAAGAGAPVVRAAISIPYPGPREALLGDARALKKFVRGALSSAPFLGRRIYSALPACDVRLVPLSVQVAAGQTEQQAVAKAARAHLGTAVNGAVIDYYRTHGEGEGPERQVLVALAEEQKVLAYLAMLCRAGFDTAALEIAPTAIARLLAALHQEDREQSILLINFGVSKSFFTMIWGGRLMLDREIEFGEIQLADKLAKSLGLEQDMALALLREHGIGGVTRAQPVYGAAQLDVGQTIREILHPELALLAEELSRTRVYVASRTHGTAVSRIYLNGGAAHYLNIEATLGELVALPLELLKPFAAFAAAPANAAVEHSIALAAGLALRGSCHG